MSPTISVIIPAYNAGDFIARAVRSALNQTCRNIEVIVVDDGSTDETAAIVKHIGQHDARVRLIRQENSGVAAARNAAIHAARAPFVAPLDADDEWEPEKLERQLNRARSAPDAGLVYSWAYDVDANGQIMGSSYPMRVEGRALWQLFVVNFIGCASVPLYRRETILAVGGYDASLRARKAEGCEDWDLSLRVAAISDIALAPGHLVRYYARAGSMSRATRTMHASYDLTASRLLREHPEIPSRIADWSYGRFAAYLSSIAYSKQEFGLAARWLLAGAARDPNLLRSGGVTGRIFRSSMGWMLGPLIHRLWPDRKAWRRFKSRFGLPADVRYSREEIEAEWDEAMPPSGWNGDSAYDRCWKKRWAWIQAAERAWATPLPHRPPPFPGSAFPVQSDAYEQPHR